MAATALVLIVAACFSDPTSSLRNGPSRLQLSQYTVTLKAGDSLAIRAFVLDDQGNQLDVGSPAWTSADSTIARVRPNGTAPGNIFAPAVVTGINNQAGITTVTITDGALQDSIRVTVLPAKLPGVVSVTGTAVADTVIINRPAPLTPLVVPYTAGDTLVLNSTATVTFSATTSTVSFGAFSGYIVARSATQIKVMSRQPFAGKPVVTNLTYAGNATTGPITIASMPVDSINLQHSRFRGTASVAGDTLTITAGTGEAFSAATKLMFYGIPSDSAVIFSQTATTIRAIAPLLPAATYLNGFTVRNLIAGAITRDSAHSIANVAMNRATFGGSVTVGNSGLGTNTLMTANAPTGVTLTTGATGSFVSYDTNAAKPGFVLGTILSRTATQIQAISTANVTGTVRVTKVILGTVTIDSLRTVATSTIAASYFPGTITNGNGRLLDTVLVKANGTGTFTTGASASNVTINGATAFVVQRLADSMKVITKHGGTAKVTVTNFIISGPLTVPSLTTAATTAVDSITTDEVGGNGAKTSGAATAIAGIVNIGDSAFVYGAMDGQNDQRDYYTFTMPAAGGTVTVTLTWFGNGGGANDANPDFDVVVCTTLSGTGSCSYGQDIIPNNAASGVTMPETGTTAAIAGSATVFVRTFSYYATGNAGEHAYQIKVKTQ